LQCEPLAAATCCSCWGTMHGGKRRSRRRGAREVGKRGGVAWAGPAVRAAGASASIAVGTGFHALVLRFSKFTRQASSRPLTLWNRNIPFKNFGSWTKGIEQNHIVLDLSKILER
jgi:hypothetical protein